MPGGDRGARGDPLEGAVPQAPALGLSGRQARRGGWKSAGMVIRYPRRETARRGAVATYLEERQDPPG